MSPSIQTRETRARAWKIKFLIDPMLAERIRRWARAHLKPDPNGRGSEGDAYRITSLYFDTDQADVFHRRGSFRRGKYRIRRYGESDWALLERKVRTRQQLTKRRTVVALGDLEQLSKEEPRRDWVGYWFHRRLRLRRLGPVCEVAYDRMARVALTQHGLLRLTLDSHLSARPVDALWFSSEGGGEFCGDQVILELKFLRAMPSLFKCLVEEFVLSPQRLSKYRLAASALGLAASAGPFHPEDCAYEPAAGFPPRDANGAGKEASRYGRTPLRTAPTDRPQCDSTESRILSSNSLSVLFCLLSVHRASAVLLALPLGCGCAAPSSL